MEKQDWQLGALVNITGQFRFCLIYQMPFLVYFFY